MLLEAKYDVADRKKYIVPVQSAVYFLNHMLNTASGMLFPKQSEYNFLEPDCKAQD